MKDKNHNILDFLSTAYDLTKVHRITRINNGDWNRVYQVDADQSWILRISHHRKVREQLEFELSLLKRLCERLTYIADITLTKDGRLFGTHQGLFCTLFKYIPGETLRVTDETVVQAGMVLGEIHEELAVISRDLQLINRQSILNLDWYDNYLYQGEVLDNRLLNPCLTRNNSMHLDAIISELEFLREIRTLLSSWLRDCRNSFAYTESIIHGDYYRRNILLNGKTITAVIDWDETNTSWLEYETANAAWEFARDDARCMINPERLSLFLNGYSSTNSPAAPGSKALIRFVGVRRLLEIQLDLFELIHNGQYDLNYCLKNIKYLKNLEL